MTALEINTALCLVFGSALIATDAKSALAQCPQPPEPINQFAILTAADAAPDDELGSSVAILDNFILVGANRDDHEQSGTINSGSVSVFQFDGSSWFEQDELTAPTPTAGGLFGSSVSISGNVALIGAGGINLEAAYVFRFDGGAWNYEATLIPGDGSSQFFGRSVSAMGERLIVGAVSDDEAASNAGAAYIFRRQGSVWVQEVKLTASDAQQGDAFGASLALANDLVLIGATGDRSVYVFRFDGVQWNEDAKITPLDGTSFGNSVSLSGDLALIGASGDDQAAHNAGAAYVFRYNGLRWNQEVKLIASDATDQALFGSSVDLSGNVAVVGARGNLNGLIGAAYVYRFDSLDWIEQVKLGPSDGQANDLFGEAVAISKHVAVVGAPRRDSACPQGSCDSGSAYVFHGLLDCNGNDVLDICELHDGQGQDCQPDGIPDECQPGTPKDVDDGVACTIDLCDPQSGDVSHLPDDSFCDDADPCTVDSCDVATGCVQDAEAANGLPCEVNAAPGECEDGVCQELCQAGEYANLTPVGLPSYSEYGISTDISAGVAIIGQARMGGGGAAHIYRFGCGAWEPEAVLTASDGSFGDRFGGSVALQGTRAVIGVPRDDDVAVNSGSAYVFRRFGAQWIEEAKFVPADAAFGDAFGTSVALSGSAALIGAPAADEMGPGSSTGSAYVFRYDFENDIWAEETELLPSDLQAKDRFGYSVDVSGQVAVIGALGEGSIGQNDGPGAAYIFRYDGALWIEEAKLTASDPAFEDAFGTSVSISGEVVVIGAPEDDDAGEDSGSAYVFRFDPIGGAWNEEAKLVSANAAPVDRFGFSVSVSGATVVVGTYRSDGAGTEPGVAHVYRFDSGTWTHEAKLKASNAESYDRFGYAVAVDGSDAIVGAWNHGNSGIFENDGSGAAYAFRGVSECNGNGVLDVCDILGGVSDDDDADGAPDECEPDCNNNDVADDCDLYDGTSADCQPDGVPDECQLGDNDQIPPDGDGLPDECNCHADDECDDGDACNGAERCSEASGLCEPGDPIDIDDAVDCTIDSCDPLTGDVSHVPDHEFCNDGEQCTIDTCSQSDGCTNSAADADGFACVLDGLTGTCVSGVCVGPCQATERSKLVASDGVAGDRLGWAVALDGDVAAVGAYLHDEAGNAAGAVYIYSFDTGTWQEQAELRAEDASAGDNFGRALDIDAEVIIVGARGDDDAGTDAGAAYVFRFDGNSWIQEDKLIAPNPAMEDEFGWSVSIIGDLAVVGARQFENAGSGFAIVYRFDGLNWLFEDRLEIAGAVPFDEFGYALTARDDLVLVSARGEQGDTGAVYVFRFDGEAWMQEARLAAGGSFLFGSALAAEGDVAVVGSPGDATSSGAAYVFVLNGSEWTQDARLTASDSSPQDRFGTSLSLADGAILIGAHQEADGGSRAGAAYAFAFDGSDWFEGAKLTASDAAADENFGLSVSLSGSVGLIGAPGRTLLTGPQPGSAYVFSGLSDCDGSAVLDLCEILDGTLPDENAEGVPDECENQAPVAVCQDVVVGAGFECHAVVAPEAVDAGSFDPDSDDVLSLILQPTGPYPLGMTEITLLVTDDSGASDTCTATITVVDQTPPSIACPANVTLECDQPTTPDTAGAATAADNCDTTPTLTFDDQEDLVSCSGTGMITRTWTATDSTRGNSSSCDQVITVVDSTAPEISVPDDVTITSGDPADPGATGLATATDNCDGDVDIIFSDTIITPDCTADPIHFTILRTWTATDDCDNSSSCLQTITVERQEVSLIIKQGACPAPLNPNSNGVAPMVLTGDTDFDVNDVLLDTLRLTRCDCSGGDVAPIDGPPGPKIKILDLNHPFNREVGCPDGPCACNADQSSDGIDDIEMKYRTDEMMAGLPLDAGETVVVLSATGELDESAYPGINVGFIGSDCILIVPPGADPINATMESNVPDTFIEVTPLDLNVDSDGFANFGRAYFPDTLVTVSAPPSSAGRPFLRWQIDGVMQPIGLRTVEVQVTSDVDLQAIYRRPSRIDPEPPAEDDGDME